MVSQEDMEKAQAALASVQDDWLQRDGVTAVDLGFKWSDGQMTDQLSIRVHVAQKKAPDALTEADLFPKELDGIPVDVIEATYDIQTAIDPEWADAQLEAAVDGRGQRFDEIPLGVSIGSPRVTAGTLGAKVFDTTTREPMILSNWHVMVGSPDTKAGDPVWQPGRLDGGTQNDVIANVSRWVLGPFDAAVAKVSGTRPVVAETVEEKPIEDVMTPRLGMFVWKSGRTTGYTEGFIDGVMMTTSLNYRSMGVRRLSSVVRVVPRPGSPPGEVSLGGDSGSIWVDAESGKAVGLHFAGEVGDAPEFALANDIISVLDHLEVVFPAQLPPEAPVEPEPPEEPIPSEPPDAPVEDPTPPEPPVAAEPPVAPTLPPPPKKQPSFWETLLQFFRNLFK